MKSTMGLILLFVVFNVSSSSSIRQFEFLKSLYPDGDIPKLVLTSMVTRRIDQVKTLYDKEWITEDGKTFLNASVQALQLLLDSMDSNDTQIGYFFEPYSHIVNLLNEANNVTRMYNVDHLTVNSSSNFTRDELEDMMNAYNEDIEMVRMCEVSLGRSVRVNLRIVELLKSLANGLWKYDFYYDDESISLTRKVMNIFLSRFKLLLNQFTDIFIRYEV